MIMTGIYIIGATGNIGSAVYNKLVKEGVNVIPLVRKKSGLKNEIVCDFSPTALQKALRNARIVINTAGSVKTYDKNELEKANVELVKSIVEAVPKKAKIIHASSISVYGKRVLQKPVVETTPINPDSDYAISKYNAEKILAAHPNTVILRIGTVYSPSEDYARILERIKKGKMYVIGDGKNVIPFVHIDDVANAFYLALKARAGVYNIVGERISQSEVYEIAAKELGVEQPKKHIPFWLANAAAFFEEKIAMLQNRKPKITREHIAILYFDRPFDCSLARKELGFVPRNAREGVREVIRETIKALQQKFL